MKCLRQKLEKIFAAITFAETGEHEKAREILKESKTIEIDPSVHSLMPLAVKGH